MKINMPVTNVEYKLKETDSIVSKTDLRGTITYINEDFLRISGFTKAELIGVSHNIVRHPDMPPEAFADLWKALKENRPWTGLVKNRCKNGDFYWVLANAIPFYENDQLAGYMSVRSKPSFEQINAADAAYRLFKEGKAGNLKIQDGKVVKSTFPGKLNPFKSLTIKSRLINVIGMLSALMIIIGGMGLHGMSKANEGLRTVYEDRTMPMDQISTIKELLLTNRLNITSVLLTPTAEMIQKNSAEVEQNITEISRIWAAYMATYLTPEEKNLADKFAADRKLFVEESLKPTMAALKAHDLELANKLVVDRINPLYKPVGEGINRLMQLQIDVAKQEFESAQSRYGHTRNIAIGLIALGIMLALWLGFTLIRGIARPFAAVISHFGRIAQGKYNNAIDIERQDEIGKVMEALKSMQTKLGFDMAESKRIADESLRIKIGLDNVSTGVMIADNARHIIYVNKSVVDILGKAEADIRKQLPNFSAANLVGTNIDGFHLAPSQQEKLLSTFNNTYVAKINLGGRSMVVSANPVINEQGQRLGAVAEWQDRTNEVAVEQEVAALVHGAVMGDFTRRINIQGKEDFFKQLGEGLNELLETTESGINDVVRVLGALSRSDLTQTITNDYAGSFGQLKDDANTTVEKLKEIIGQIKDATNGINTGAKEIASGNNDLSHRTEEQAASLEETAASMEELTSTVQHNAANAKQANQLAVDASNIAGKGVEVVGQVVKTMDTINDSSRRIGDIISVIDDIAFQTNILALNAAVEAARAGEQGRGFAVVAVEVRNLAQRAATAAGEIKNLIDDSVVKVTGGSKLVTQAGQTMEEIVNSIRGVTVMMSEISAASAEQTSGIEQVNQAISQMDDVTQQNAALVEQAAAAAESLEEQAQSLSATVAQFKVEGYSRYAHNSMAQVSSFRAAPPQRETAIAKAGAVKKSASVKPKPILQSSSDDWEEF
ncbi:methyl-accepting chemotaxis protein [Methylobacter sp.]|uniref:methyl-accepting chemotaxis protein n=1 Tax=Methylobacter sp. TaxID=2051955 RepID=UPI00120B36B6|nr:methyl-accepting chemotaxis protein [Methylobacter sp.]TAK61042.1 MAG: PAS domain-containing protein [Methylobacter sp.]